MRYIILILFLLAVVSCKQYKPKESLITNDLKYSGYYWLMNENLLRWEFYLDQYIDIDKNGHFVLLRHNEWRGKPSYYSGEINDTIRNLIDSTFNNKKYKKDYVKTGAIIYDGLTYCLDYTSQDSNRNTIRFIPNDCPEEINELALLFDKLINKNSLQPISALNIDAYVNELAHLDTSLTPLPVFEPIKFKVPQANE